MDFATIGLLCLAGFCGGFTQGLAGFGSTLIALPLLALVFDLKLAVPVCTTLAVVLNAVMIARLGRHVRFGPLLLLIAASLPGIPLGAYALRALPGHWLKTILALAIIAFVGNQWRTPGRLAPAGPGWGVAASLRPAAWAGPSASTGRPSWPG